MPEDSALIIEEGGPIVTLRLNDPPLNPIGVAHVAALGSCLPRLDADPKVRVIVIRGEGVNFSVGANLKEAGIVLEVGAKKFVKERMDLYASIEAMSKPVIAAIRGYCLGGGLELAMSCHLRIAEEEAQISLPEIDLGAAPMWSGAGRILRLVGRTDALDLLLRGRRIDAREAARMRLVNEALPADDFEDAVQELARELAAKPPLAVAAILRVVNRSRDLPLDQALAEELEEFSRLAGTQDNIEGVRAMFEKRRPRFVGE